MSNRPPSVQSPLSLFMPLASTAAIPAVVQAMQQNEGAFSEALKSIGTVHFARFLLITNRPDLGLPIGDNATLALFTEYDGDFATYVKDFVAKLGPIFDALLQHVADPPPLPVADYSEEFVAWVNAHNPASATFYSAYPTLSVIDILGMSGT